MSQALTKEQQQVQTYQGLIARKNAARDVVIQFQTQLKAAEQDVEERSLRVEELFGTRDIEELKDTYRQKFKQNDDINNEMEKEVSDIEGVLRDIKLRMDALK
ncbi:hypothetical protein RYA05_05155 [Pseudomonas syringae pv. actinidiae]|nr:hypothetical protein [Pseudomonas syringae pv. actinidiae]